MREDKFIEREKTKTRVRWFCSLLLLFLCLFDSLRLNLGHSVWLLKNRVRFCNVLFLHSVRKQEQQRKRNVMKNNGHFVYTTNVALHLYVAAATQSLIC